MVSHTGLRLYRRLSIIELSGIKALTFDVFGTVADWRSTIIREGSRFGKEKGIDIDWSQFADTWRAGYKPSMNRVRTGELPWMNIDSLHMLILEDLLIQFHISGLSEAEKEHLNGIWHRLDLWPDVASGLKRLRRYYVVAPLSNGNISLLTNLSKHAGIYWDCILSSELVRHYKPDQEVYLYAAELLGLLPKQIIMVAAHNGDLKAASSTGYGTAFVYRTTEYGHNQTTNLEPEPGVDIVTRDFNDLADQLTGSSG